MYKILKTSGEIPWVGLTWHEMPNKTWALSNTLKIRKMVFCNDKVRSGGPIIATSFSCFSISQTGPRSGVAFHSKSELDQRISTRSIMNKNVLNGRSYRPPWLSISKRLDRCRNGPIENERPRIFTGQGSDVSLAWFANQYLFMFSYLY